MDLTTWFDIQAHMFPQAALIDLMHVRSTETVRTTRLVIPEKDKASVVSLLLTSAHQAVRGFRGPQTFLLYLLEQDGHEPLVQHSIVLQDNPTEHPASMEGVAKLLMQQNETLLKRVNETVKSAQQSQVLLAEENERLRARCSVVEEKHLEMIALQEELLTQRHVRELETYRAKNAEARKSHLTASLTGLMPTIAPTIANKALGIPLPEQDPAIAALGKDISPEQFAQLQKVLKPTQVAALLGILQRHGGISKGEPEPPKKPPQSGMN